MATASSQKQPDNWRDRQKQKDLAKKQAEAQRESQQNALIRQKKKQREMLAKQRQQTAMEQPIITEPPEGIQEQQREGGGGQWDWGGDKEKVPQEKVEPAEKKEETPSKGEEPKKIEEGSKEPQAKKPQGQAEKKPAAPEGIKKGAGQAKDIAQKTPQPQWLKNLSGISDIIADPKEAAKKRLREELEKRLKQKAKETAKEGLKAGTKELGKDLAKQGAKQAAKEIVKETAKQIAKVGLKEGLKMGVRLVADTVVAGIPVVNIIVWIVVEVGFQLLEHAKTILIVLGAIILLMLAMFFLIISSDKFKGADENKPPNLTSPVDVGAIKVLAAAIQNSAESAQKAVAYIKTNLNVYLDNISDLLNKEVGKGIKSSGQKSTLDSKISDIKGKITEIEGKIGELQAIEAKKEEEMEESDFDRRETLRTEIDNGISDMKAKIKELRNEFNKCEGLPFCGTADAKTGLMKLPGDSFLLFNNSFTPSLEGGKHQYTTEMVAYRLYKAIEAFGGEVYVGDASLEGGDSSLFHGEGHQNGLYVDLAGPGIIPESQKYFGVDYEQSKAKLFLQKLWDHGAESISLNDPELNQETYNNIFDQEVPLSASASGCENHIHVQFPY